MMWMRACSVVVGFAVLSTAPTILANEAAIKQCRDIRDSAQRLACYDAIALPQASTPLAPTASAAAPTAARASAAPSATPAQPAASGAPKDVAEFGLPAKVRAAEVDRVNSRVKGRLESWQQGTRIRLDNGQLWQVSDDSTGLCNCDSPKVEIYRGALGTFFMSIEGKRAAPRVKRLE
jgi:hypothetical protein